jgi:flagellar biosynthetic protein FlhB
MADNKTEQATPKKREMARGKGQIARSRELPGVFALAAVAGVMAMMAPMSVTHWTTLYRDTLYVASTANLDINGPILFWSEVEVLRWIVPILMAAMALSAFAGLMQGGFSFAPEALALKFDRFNPASKLGQIFSITGVNNMLKSLLPFGAILWIAISAIKANWQMMERASSLGMRTFASFVGDMIFGVTWKSGMVLLAWSAVDYLLTWQKMESDLKMSKQEIIEEYKTSEGSPLIKSKIRQLRRALRRKQSLKAAATATVIITNPTHYAIALRYETDMPAPLVVAKGRDLLAEKIKQLARDNGIMLIENKPLAQALYKSVEVGDAIPAKLYQAVAEILVIVFRAQAEVRKREAERRNRNASGSASANASGNVPAGANSTSGGRQ